MLLVMDVGNTNIVFGIYEQEKLRHFWRLHTNRNATEDEYAVLIGNLLSRVDVSFEHVEGVAIASVVPPIMYTLESMFRKYFHLEPLIVGPGVRTGLNITYENPRDVGADRIANAVAAIHNYGSPVIIVDFGTATTFCLVDPRGNYLGGVIAPGIGISVDALVSRAAQLTKFELIKPEHVLGRNTIKAMQSGVYYGYVGLVDGIVRRLQQEHQYEAPVVATGGLADLISTGTETIDFVNPLLTLEGLHLIYKRNEKSIKGASK